MNTKVKIIAAGILAAAVVTACGTSAQQAGTSNTQTPPAQSASAEATQNRIPITLTIGDKVLDAYLDDSAPVRSLMAKLPMTVSLSRGSHDYCGDNIDLAYTPGDVKSGFKNGELCFWTTANNFVIFTNGEEESANIGNLVHLGQVTSPISMLNNLGGAIQVKVALKENTAAQPEETLVRITANGHVLTARLENNATTRALIAQMPYTIKMEDLYDREMCYRYGQGAFPTDHLRSDNYQLGDIAYWPPRGSLVILYEQNGEQFERQHLGHIDSGVELFKTTGTTNVTFEVLR